ncbi:hypothetical protein QBC44DRAFT_404516 [Cladorrhinum sp. PSN332]|nr:hypothetical protein QBC44DRAFT_404516 [Cladorrhinum sp. PSN332]
MLSQKNQSVANMHVHIGKGDQRFTALEIKKLATILWLGEHRLNDLHKREPHTVDSPYARNFKYTYIGSADLGSDVMKKYKPSGEYHDWLESPMSKGLEHVEKPGRQQAGNSDLLWFNQTSERLKYLWSCETLKEVCVLLFVRAEVPGSLGQYTAGCNFLNLIATRHGGESMKNTIEFRKPAATTNYEVSRHWCLIYAKIVHFACVSSHSQFAKIVKHLFMTSPNTAAWKC